MTRFLTATAPCAPVARDGSFEILVAAILVWDDRLTVTLVATGSDPDSEEAFTNARAAWEANPAGSPPPDHPASEALQRVALRVTDDAGNELVRTWSSVGGTGTEREATVSFVGRFDRMSSATVKGHDGETAVDLADTA